MVWACKGRTDKLLEQVTNVSKQHEPLLSFRRFDGIFQTLILWTVRYVSHSKELESSS